MNSIEGMTVDKTIEYLGIELNPTEKWLLMEKLCVMKQCNLEYLKAEHERLKAEHGT